MAWISHEGPVTADQGEVDSPRVHAQGYGTGGRGRPHPLLDVVEQSEHVPMQAAEKVDAGIPKAMQFFDGNELAVEPAQHDATAPGP